MGALGALVPALPACSFGTEQPASRVNAENSQNDRRKQVGIREGGL